MVVVPGVGHRVAEQAPEEMLAALSVFLAPYREGRSRRRKGNTGAVIDQVWATKPMPNQVELRRPR